MSSPATDGAGHLTATDLAGFLGHALTGAEQRTVEAHLERCPQCRGKLVQMFGIAGTLGAGQRERRRSRRIARRWLVSAVVVVGLVVLLLMLRFWSPGGAVSPPPSPPSPASAR